MFGLSFTKLVLLILVIGAVIYGTRLLRALGRPDSPAPRQPGRSDETNATTTFEKCPRCGAYVDPARHRCGKQGHG